MNSVVRENAACSPTASAPSGAATSARFVRTVATSPAAWLFAAAWLGGSAVLLTHDARQLAVRGAIRLGVCLALAAGTCAIAPAPGEETPAAGRRPSLQLLLLLLLALVPAAFQLRDVAAGGTVRAPGFVPVLLFWIRCFVLPAALLAALGVPWRALGLRRGTRSLAVAALWCVPVAFVLAIRGTGGVLRLLRQALSHLFQNGFFEEFLHRGALYTRVRLLAGPGWALSGGALLFAATHAPGGVEAISGNLAAGFASSVVMIAPVGLALGVVFERTRSLLAPTLVHVGSNLVADVF